jgi:hypothetical protein
MAFEEASVNISMVANAQITIYRFVDIIEVSSASQIDMTDDPAERVIGISQESTDTTVTANLQVVPVAISGVAMIELGATLAAGVNVSSGANGVAVAGVTTAADYQIGPLLQGGDSGDIVAILLNIYHNAGA